jgi:hypothetical protein
MKPNKSIHTNRRRAFQSECACMFGRWIGCRRPFPAAVGDLHRSA